MRIIRNLYDNNILRAERAAAFTLAWDMDNTLVDDTGARTRPGAVDALETLRKAGVRQVVWTHSTGARARDVLAARGLDRYFDALIARESYDLAYIREPLPERYAAAAAAFPREVAFQNVFPGGKNLSLPGYPALVDDNPETAQQAANRGGAWRVFCVTPFTGRARPLPDEMRGVADAALRLARPQSLLARFGAMARGLRPTAFFSKMITETGITGRI